MLGPSLLVRASRQKAVAELIASPHEEGQGEVQEEIHPRGTHTQHTHTPCDRLPVVQVGPTS